MSTSTRPRILVVGSFVLDQVAITSVFPEEGETVLGEGFSKAPGGKGANQAVCMARLGCDVTIIGKLGRDSNGEDLLKACVESGVDVSKVLYDEKAASGCAVIVIEKRDSESACNRIIVIPGTNMLIRKEELEFLEEEIKNYSLVVLQLEIPMEINEYIADLAYRNNIPVMLNPAPSNRLSDELLRHITFISPNEHEASDLTGVSIPHDGDLFDMDKVRECADALHDRGVSNVLITLGSAGAYFSNSKQEVFSPAISAIKAVDPTAAGDSFIGAFCYGYVKGWDFSRILEFANHVSALTVSRLGAMPSLPFIEEVRDLMQRSGCSIVLEEN